MLGRGQLRFRTTTGLSAVFPHSPLHRIIWRCHEQTRRLSCRDASPSACRSRSAPQRRPGTATGDVLSPRPSDPVRGRGMSRSGWDEVSQTFHWLASRFSNCTAQRFDLVAAGISGDLAYTVGVEHTAHSRDGVPEEPYTLWVTHIYRREDSEWKIVPPPWRPPPDRSASGRPASWQPNPRTPGVAARGSRVVLVAGSRLADLTWRRQRVRRAAGGCRARPEGPPWWPGRAGCRQERPRPGAQSTVRSRQGRPPR